jgi:hypothetical protein
MDAPVPEIDTSRPHAARMYDYFLGGKDHFAADRVGGDQVLAAFPSMRTAARENRAFLGRAVRYLAEEAWTSAPGCPPSATSMRSRRASPLPAGSYT